WNDTLRAVPESTVPALIEAQVARTPDATAVVGVDAALSYAELDSRANRLSRLLADRGVGPETLVAVLLEPSAEQVVALLAVLKAGGAYVPIEPSYPGQRVELVLRDAGPALVMTRSTSEARVSATTTAPLLVLDDP